MCVCVCVCVCIVCVCVFVCVCIRWCQMGWGIPKQVREGERESRGKSQASRAKGVRPPGLERERERDCKGKRERL